MISIKIDVKKIDKARLFQGRTALYLDAVLIEKPDDYGNDGFVAHDTTKEERQNGVKGKIIGNWKHVGTKKAPAPPKRKPEPDPDLDVTPEGDIPF